MDSVEKELKDKQIEVDLRIWVLTYNFLHPPSTSGINEKTNLGNPSTTFKKIHKSRKLREYRKESAVTVSEIEKAHMQRGYAKWLKNANCTMAVDPILLEALNRCYLEHYLEKKFVKFLNYYASVKEKPMLNVRFIQAHIGRAAQINGNEMFHVIRYLGCGETTFQKELNPLDALHELWCGVKVLRKRAEEQQIKVLQLPRYSGGVDFIVWPTLVYMLQFIFSQTNIEITIINCIQYQKIKTSVATVSAMDWENIGDPKLLDDAWTTLPLAFHYLDVHDLLRASEVCPLWRDIANDSTSWRNIRLKTLQGFQTLSDSLKNNGTVHLNLKEVWYTSIANSAETWNEFSREIKKVISLRKIDLCRCPATVVEQLALSNPKLEVINAVNIDCETMSIASLASLKDLKVLRLKSDFCFSLTPNLNVLAEFKKMTDLNLTSIKNLNTLNIDVIGNLGNLQSLGLGECRSLPKTFGSEILIKLTKLVKLRLESGCGDCYIVEMLKNISKMKHLLQLELVNFTINTGFDKALGACCNIKKLLIKPFYFWSNDSAVMNRIVISGVLLLKSTLSVFVWGMSQEMLYNQVFNQNNLGPIGYGCSIPIAKPSPFLKAGLNRQQNFAGNSTLQIIPLPIVMQLLHEGLPTTRIESITDHFDNTSAFFL